MYLVMFFEKYYQVAIDFLQPCGFGSVFLKRIRIQKAIEYISRSETLQCSSEEFNSRDYTAQFVTCPLVFTLLYTLYGGFGAVYKR